MPKKKPEPKRPIPNFQPPDDKFEFNKGFRFGLADNPPLLGQKPIPEGKPGCLEGLTFTATGTMPSLTRDMLKEILEKYGARLTSSISGKTDVVIRGCIEVGPKKLQDAISRKLTIIDEDSLFAYLESTNPGAAKPPTPKIPGGKELPELMFPKSSLLTEKYRPRLLEDVIGNLGPINHLIDFFKNYSPDENPKCAIVSGPPGIGKSTCASLVALYCGYTPTEYNASDTRSKKMMNDTMAELFSNKSLLSLDDKEKGKPTKICVIMDEVDGMSTGDRGGLQELVKYVDSAINPVICICNDRDSSKFTTLAKRSVDIKFIPPTKAEIVKRLEYIAKEEKITISEENLRNIAEAGDGDIRASINMLQFWSQKESELGDLKSIASKEIPLVDPIDATIKLLKPSTSLEERFDCYFLDYGLMPLYFHENIQCLDPDGYADAMESIAIGDVLNTEVNTNTNYSLLVPTGFYSTVLPSIQSPGKDWGGMTKFPQYFGKMSRTNKLKRYILEISSKLTRTSNVSSEELYDTTLKVVLDFAKKYLAKRGGNVDAFLDILDSLELTLDDYEHLCEILIFCTPGELSRKMPGAPSMKSELKEGYKERHTNASGVIGHLDAVREDYYIQYKPDFIPATKPKNKKAKAPPRLRVSEEGLEINDDLLEESSSSDSDNETEDTQTKTRGRGRGGASRGRGGRGRGRGRGRRANDDDFLDDDEDDAPKTRRGRQKKNYAESDDGDDVPNAEDEAFIADDSEDDAPLDLPSEETDDDIELEDDDDDDEELELSDDDDVKKKKQKQKEKKEKKQAPKSKILKKHKGKKSKRGL